MGINLDNKLVGGMLNIIQHYNHEKYWRMRAQVVDPASRTFKLLRLYYLLRIKKMDAYNNASMGTNLGNGATFVSPPFFPHGLNGIIIHPRAVIGKNCMIFQQVTVGSGGDGKAAVIGDNCTLGAGAKIIGPVHLGNSVTVGANAVVVYDVPDNCTVAGVPAKIVKLDGKPVNISLKDFWSGGRDR